MVNTYTNTYTYTRTRVGVINDHFEMFLSCSTMSRDSIKKLLMAVENMELSAVGIYIEEDGYRIAEVEFEVDWDEHQRMVGVYGERFDTNLPGWNENVSPEAYIAAQRLVQAAQAMDKQVHSWIRVSPSVRSVPSKHQTVCANLGYSYGSTVPPWKSEPVTQHRNVNYLPEATVIQRVVR